MCSNISLQPPSYSTLPLLTWWEELLLTLICLRFFVQSDFVGHLISEIASDMKGMLARQWCFMLHSISVGSKQSWAMSSGSNLIFEHQLSIVCACCVYTYNAPYGHTHFRHPRHATALVSFPLVFLRISFYRMIEVWLGPFQRPGVRFRAERYVEGRRVKVRYSLGRDHHKLTNQWGVAPVVTGIFLRRDFISQLQWRSWWVDFMWLLHVFHAIPFSLLQALDENKSSTVTVGAFMVLNSALNLSALDAPPPTQRRDKVFMRRYGTPPAHNTLKQKLQSCLARNCSKYILVASSCINLPEHWLCHHWHQSFHVKIDPVSINLFNILVCSQEANLQVQIR